MNNQNIISERPLHEIVVGKRGSEGKGTKVAIYLPDADEVALALAGEGELAPVAYDVFKRGWIGIIRNDIAPDKAGNPRYPVPTNVATFIANQEAKEVSKANRGAALRERRESVDAFCRHLAAQGVKQGGVDLLRKTLANGDLIQARADLHTRITARLEAWAGTLSDAELQKHARFLQYVQDNMDKEAEAVDF